MQHFTSAALRAAYVLVVVPFALAGAQSQNPGSRAPTHIPAQLLAAKNVFISNAGGDSYGAESYFRLTKYNGGPNRFYNAYYHALSTWGRYRLVDSPAAADVVLQVRFSNPLVERRVTSDAATDASLGVIATGEQTAGVYDPQLNLVVIDPMTRVTLWTLTEHIEPGKNEAANDTNFDQAVARIVEDTKTLADATPATLANTGSDFERASIPAGAYTVLRHDERMRNTSIGFAAGGLAASAIMLKSITTDCGGSPCGFSGVRNDLYLSLGAIALGALVGWLWPTG